MADFKFNSLRNKFEAMKSIITPSFDIFLVSKLFPNNQFSTCGYRLFRQDKNSFGGGICTYVKKIITSKQVNLHLDKETGAIYFQINSRFRKRLNPGLYKSPSQSNSMFLENTSENISRYLVSYKNITLVGDFNITSEDKN